jgi:hypothetical protein
MKTALNKIERLLVQTLASVYEVTFPYPSSPRNLGNNVKCPSHRSCTQVRFQNIPMTAILSCVWYSHNSKSLKPKRTLSASPHIIPFNVVFHEDSSLVAITITITNKSTRTHRPPSPPKLPLHSAAAALAYNNDQ